MAGEKASVWSGSASRSVGNPADLEEICRTAIELGKQTRRHVNVRLGAGEYWWDRPLVGSIPGIIFRGEGESTKVGVRSTEGAKVWVPRVDGSTFVSRETDCLGLYISTVRGIKCEVAEFSGFHNRGILSTPSTTSGIWTPFRVLADDLTLADIKFTNEESLVYSATNKNPYKSLKARSIAQGWGFASGECKALFPDPDRTPAVNRINARNLYALGEPLSETGEALADARAGLLWLRNVNAGTIRGIKGSQVNDRSLESFSDFVFSAQPAADNTFVVSFWNPVTRKQESQTYTWKSGTASGAYQINIGANKEVDSQNLAARILGNGYGGGGTDYLTALNAFQVLGDATIALTRVKAVQRVLNGPEPYYGYGALSVQVAITGSYGTIRSDKTKRRWSYWKQRILKEDSPFVVIEDIDVACSQDLQEAVCELSTQVHNDFSVDEFSEAGHGAVRQIVGDGWIFGRAGVGIYGSAFSEVTQVHPGQSGAGGGKLVKIDKGNHKRERLSIAVGNASDTNHFDLNDNQGNARVFTFKAAPDPTVLYDLAIGVDAATSMATVRNAILDAQILGQLNAFPGPVTDLGGGTFAIDVTYYSHEYSYTPVTTATGANLAVTAGSLPYRPCYAKVQTAAHGMIDELISAGQSLDANSIYGHLDAELTLLHELPMALAKVQNENWVGVFNYAAPGTPGAVPAVTDKVKIRLSAASSYIEFQFNTGTDLPGLTYFVGVPAGGSDALKFIDASKKLVDKMQAVLARTPCWYVNFDGGAAPAADNSQITITGRGSAYVFEMDHSAPAASGPLTKIFDHGTTYAEHALSLADEINKYFPGHASLLGTTTVMIKKGGDITAVAETTDTGNDFTVRSDAADAVVTSAYATYTDGPLQILKGSTEADASFVTFTLADPLTFISVRTPGWSAASASAAGAVAPIHTNNVRSAKLKVRGFPLVSSAYASASTFSEAYGAPTALTAGQLGNQSPIQFGFNGLQKELLYAERDASEISKITIDADLFGPWAPGRFGDARFFSLAGSMAAADITVLAPSNVRNP